MSSVEEDGSKENKPRKLTSWIWQYFKEETNEVKKGEECVNVLVMVCQVKEGSSLAICGTEYVRKDSSTGNAISHLRAKHNIVQSGEPFVQTETPRKGKRYTKQQQKELRQFLVDWIISDSLPIHTVQSEAFRRFIYELDPVFTMPCEETVRKIIHEAYNYSFPQLKDMLSSERLEDAQKNFPGLQDELEREIILQNEEEDNEQDEQDIIDPSNTSKYLHTIADTSTRWNSSYLAWNSSDEWDLLRDLKPILQPFAEATDLLGGSNYCTFSIMNPILTQIKKQFAPPISYNINHDYCINFQNEETAFDDIIDEEEDNQ
ncbi:unnamed protein product [Rhizophagus irregularis]|nr:unnamed protein product [Rhizophagus irregularis]